MWMKTHVITVPDIKPEQVWRVWSDITKRPLWDVDTEWATLEGPFATGSIIHMKPIGGPQIKMQITECIPNQCFTDCYKISFLARLYGIHEMEQTNQGLCLTTTIKIEGPLGWLLRKIIGEKVAAEVPEQTQTLINLVRAEGNV